MLSSAFELILISDADLSTPMEEIEKLLPWLENGHDIVVGSRGLRGSELLKKQPWHRQSMGKIFNFFVRSLVFGGIRDTQCGFKLFKSAAANKLFALARINRFAFDVEILFLAGKMGYRIKEVPVKWINSPQSKVRIIKDSSGMLFDLLKIKFLHSGKS